MSFLKRLKFPKSLQILFIASKASLKSIVSPDFDFSIWKFRNPYEEAAVMRELFSRMQKINKLEILRIEFEITEKFSPWMVCFFTSIIQRLVHLKKIFLQVDTSNWDMYALSHTPLSYDEFWDLGYFFKNLDLS